MNMQVFTSQTLDELTNKAKANPRLRQHKNIHSSYQDPCQRLFNAIEPGVATFAPTSMRQTLAMKCWWRCAG